MFRALAALVLTLIITTDAEARQRHKSGLHPECNVTMPCIAPYASTPAQVRVARGRYIARQVGFGGPNVKRAVRAPKARPAISYVAPAPSAGYTIARPMRYIAGRLICAVNVNAALAERGIRGTGSAWAKSFLTWGRSAGGPVPGAVIVSSRGRRGGHVAIVSRVERGVVYAWNATGGQSGWREIPYRKAVIDYRVPG